MSRRSWSIRGRLFAGYVVALALCSVLVAVIVYVAMRFLPTYRFSQTEVVDAGDRAFVPGRDVAVMPTAEAARILDVSSSADLWRLVLVVCVVAVVFVLGLGIGGGWFLSRRMLAPLQAITEAAERAAAGDLSSRIQATGPHDELRRLADTFDTTMGRLETSLNSHRRFAANASHELLTPLTTTRGLLELLPGAEPDERVELLDMLSLTNERNSLLVRRLLDLARAEHLDPAALEAVDLSEVVNESVADSAAHAESRGIEIITTNLSAVVDGDHTLLRHLVRNLIDNAISHNLPHGWVHVQTTNSAHGVVLTIENSGEPIAPDDATHIAEPFQRLNARIHTEDHHGLGLAIVAAVTRAHNANLTLVARENGGLQARIEFPAKPR